MGARHMQLLGAIWVVVVVFICAFSAETDAHERCRPGFATCHKGRSCKTQVSCDPQNCGKCGVRCPNAAHGEGKCKNGRCTLECQERQGWRDCDSNRGNGCETNINTNPNHCGKCGKVCPAPPADGNATCSKKDGCGIQCNARFSKCGTQCLDLQTDTSNCGTCGNVCAAPANGTASCSSGLCGVACNDGFTLCGGQCLDVNNDVTNCGSCSNACQAPAYGTASCSSGSCVTSCKDGFMLCGDKCLNLDNDMSNCGSCGNACQAPANGNVTCSGGSCNVTCKEGLTLCGGQCVNVDSNLFNCGSCGNACRVVVLNSKSAFCSGGTCDFQCYDDYDKCSGGPSGDVCTSFQVDVNNCGGCNQPCPQVENGFPICSNGQCSSQCQNGFTLCEGKCVDTLWDSKNCGGCGSLCEGTTSNCNCLMNTVTCNKLCALGECLDCAFYNNIVSDPLSCLNQCH
ncbi:hypothetical protein KC19_12G051700 [Ceratodon purpureus]|uniref:TNFR-Cys domain-containing protein n=1 Tax=Ceratodon purpureus TaxID=3225 RepID=A0A8T0G4Y4_CERPU|nr:hypothetical protein KC19_12G051700 [Ceratodon purpureus]KAG0553952.1 hypothetical protein KC19_12G051700 [Ceratodon purpureus]